MLEAVLSKPYLGQHKKFHYARHYIIFETNANDVVDFWNEPQKYEITRITIMPSLRRYITPFTPKKIRAERPFIPKEIRQELIDYLRNEWKYHGPVVFKEPHMN